MARPTPANIIAHRKRLNTGTKQSCEPRTTIVVSVENEDGGAKIYHSGNALHEWTDAAIQQLAGPLNNLGCNVQIGCTPSAS